MIPKDAKEYYRGLVEKGLPLLGLKDKWCLELIEENNRLRKALKQLVFAPGPWGSLVRDCLKEGKSDA